MGNVENRRHTKTEQQLAVYNRASALMALALCLFCIYFGALYYRQPSDINTVRLKMQEVLLQVEEQNYEELDQYQAMVVDTKGIVQYSNMNMYHEGEEVNLHMFSYGGQDDRYQKHYIAPIVQNGVQTGMLYIEHNVSKKITFSLIQLIPVGLFVGLIIVLLLRRRFIRNDVVIPIVHLNSMAGEIARGNYKIQYTYETSNEIGQLCKKIESLRDELDISTENEKKLRENEKMLLTSISHDLKTPIATISGFAEGIRDKIAHDEETIHRYALTIIKKTELLTKLINDIIANTESEDGEMRLHKQELLADEFINEVLLGLQADIENKGLQLVKKQIPNAMICIDPDKMYQVFQNIIGNSLKYTKWGGSITVSAFQRKQDIVITIQDTGQGIAAQDIPYVFDKFYRGERARTQNIGGSGLGLSIVRNIVEKHGGKVECESEVGEGTAISFTIMLA